MTAVKTTPTPASGVHPITIDLAAWYEKNARVLPWRVSPKDVKRGIRPDPYHVLISETMLQQTTVATVMERFPRFLEEFPTVKALAAATQDAVMEAWAGLGYYSRARNLHAAARLIDAYGFPRQEEGLRALPGVGAYTAAAIAALAFDAPAVVVDGNIERVTSRLFLIDEPLPKAKKRIRDAAGLLTPHVDAGNHAQALMDLSAALCRPRNPACDRCPLSPRCAAYQADPLWPARLPNKPGKKQKPTRSGGMVVWRHEGGWILERRPEKGLLGSTLGWFGHEWEDRPTKEGQAWAADQKKGQVRHTLTHMHLCIDVFFRATKGPLPASNTRVFIPDDNFRPDRLTTLMRKVFACAEKKDHMPETEGRHISS